MARPLSDAVVRNRKSPIWSGYIVSHVHSAAGPVARKRVLEGIDDELRYDEAEADGLAGRGDAVLDMDTEVGRRSPIIDAARVSHSRVR